MHNQSAPIHFTPVTPDHYALLRGWLAKPHMREWWGEPKEELGHIRDMVDGRDTTRPFLILLDDSPIGYIQYWFIGDHQNAAWMADHPWLRELPSDALGIDLSIGIPDLLSQGLGSRALALFCRDLYQKGHKTLIIDPDPRNTRAVRAYEKAGFRPHPTLIGRTGDALIMQYDPAA